LTTIVSDRYIDTPVQTDAVNELMTRKE